MKTRPPKRSILIVDDDERDIVKPNCEYFGLEGWQATGALNGGEGLELLRQRRFDVVLLDIRMPGEDGLSVLKRILAEFPQTCVIMYTAFDTQENFREAFRSGAWDFLSKPMDPRELVSQVEVQLVRYLESRGKDSKIASLTAFFNFCRALTHGQKNRMDPIRVWTRKMASEQDAAKRQSILHEKLEPLFDDTRQCLERFEHYARFEDATPSEISLLHLCREAAGTAASRFARRRFGDNPIIHCGGDASIQVSADPVLLGEIADNLFSNALESSTPGSPVTATLRKEAGLAILRVEDSGSGFDSDVLPHLGETVVTTKKSQGGFGVGVLMAARIAKQLGGGFAAGNRSDGPGAWVELSIPLSTSTTE